MAMVQDFVLLCKAMHLGFCESALNAEIQGIVLGLKMAVQNKCRVVALRAYSTEAWAFRAAWLLMVIF